MDWILKLAVGDMFTALVDLFEEQGDSQEFVDYAKFVTLNYRFQDQGYMAGGNLMYALARYSSGEIILKDLIRYDDQMECYRVDEFEENILGVLAL